MEPFLLTSDVARILNCSPDYIRQFENAKQIIARKTENGVRLFDRNDVERFARKRASRTETRSSRR
jgi:DNA-binding transcriptional MerR regulator